MKRYLIFLLMLGMVAACSPARDLTQPPSGSPLNGGREFGSLATPSALRQAQDSARGTGTPSGPTADPYLQFHASETAIALNKAALDQQALALQQQQAALNMQMTVDAATSTAVAAVTRDALSALVAAQGATQNAHQTATAYPLTQTPQAATQQALESKQKWDRAAAPIHAFFWPVAGLLTLGFFIYVALRFVTVRIAKMRLVQRDERGELPGVLTNQGETLGLLDNTKSATPHTKAGLTEEPSDKQMALYARHAETQEVRAVAGAMANRRRGNPFGAGSVPITKPSAPLLGASMNLPLPGWELISSWTGGARPLGIGERGLIAADAASPHILVAGMTGSGKTRFLMRPLTAAALADGQQVVILSMSGNGYGVFDEHPNAYRIPLANAKMVIPYLQRAYRELRERDQLIGGRDLTWERWADAPRPRTLLVLEELGNMAEAIYTDEGDPKACAEMWNWVTMLAREGRKVGMEFVAAVQEPTSKSVDLRFRRNCTRVSFQLADQNSSQVFLGVGGAEKLRQGYFMATVNGMAVGGGFCPTDDEIAAFLASRPAQKLAEPEWIEGKVVEPTEGVDIALTPGPSPSGRGENSRDLEIWSRHVEGQSLARIQREVLGYEGGDAFRTVKDVIGRYQTSGRVIDRAPTTTTTTREMPVSGPLAA